MRNSRRFVAVGGYLLSCLGAACAGGLAKGDGPTQLWGFTAPWDPRSANSVVAHAAQLDVVVSGWIALDSMTFQPVVVFPDTFVARARASRARGRTRYMALVTSYQGTRFHPETVRGVGADSAALAKEAGAIAAVVGGAGYRGVILDLEGMTAADLPVLLAFTKAVADSAHAHGIQPVGLAVPAMDTLGYPAGALLRGVDFLMVMLYDQHWLTSPPGPIAAPDWVERMLALRTSEVGGESDKLVAAFPTYGYQWRPDSATAVLSYDDARQRAAGAHVGLARDSASMTLHVASPPWEIWGSDAVLLDTLVREARSHGITRVALWRLGLEDPAVWTWVKR